MGVSAILSGIQYSMRAIHWITNINTVVYSINLDMIRIFAIVAGVFAILYTPLILALEKKLDAKILWYYILYPLYSITWLPISIQGIIDKNNKEWCHTVHTRSVDITDLEKVN
jgi:hypothetical protein